MDDPKWEPENRHHDDDRFRALIFLARTPAKPAILAILKVDELSRALRCNHPLTGAGRRVGPTGYEAIPDDVVFKGFAAAVIFELMRLIDDATIWEPEPPAPKI